MTAFIERYRRREASVEESLIEMYLARLSVRRVETITEALWATRFSASTVSRWNKRTYQHIERWRNRPIRSQFTYVYLYGVVRAQKTVNVLDKLPQSQYSDAKSALREIWQTDSRAAAKMVFDRFVKIRRKISEDCRVSRRGSSRAACVLRLSGQALAAHPDDEPD